MYERFTDRARKVMQLANQEAQRLRHEYIGTEHILLGLLAEGNGVAAAVLKNLGLDVDKLRVEVARLTEGKPARVAGDPPRAKKVIEYAMEEARNLNHNYVGTEHLLLGLVREQEGLAARVLTNLGIKLDDVREEVLNLLGHGTTEPPANDYAVTATDDLPPELKETTAALDAEIARLDSEKEIAVAQQDFQTAATLRDRADHLARTKAAMFRNWVTHYPADPAWLSANGGMVLKLARRIDSQQHWDELPELADALLEAGCTDPEILNHCREGSEHSSHCWVIDVLLAHA